MSVQLDGKAARHRGLGIDPQRSGIFQGARFAYGRLIAAGLGVAMTLPMVLMIAAPAASAATASNASPVRAASVAPASEVRAVTPAVATGSAVSAAAGRCYSKEAKIKGKSVIVNCGPASVKLLYKGKTYVFKSGECLNSSGSVTLALGTSMVNNAKGNGGFTQFSITLLPKPASGTAQVTADDGTLHLVAFSATSSKIAVTGTFKGTNDASTAAPFSGSWNCGGAIYKF